VGQVIPQTNPPPEKAKWVGAAWWVPYVAIAAALGLFGLLGTAVLFHDQPFPVDLSVADSIQSAPWPPGFYYFMRAESWPGDEMIWAATLVLAVFIGLLVLRAWRPAVTLLLAVCLGQVLMFSVKEFVERPRPPAELRKVYIEPWDIHSFPSGHTTHYVVFFGFLFFLALGMLRPRLLRWAALGLLGSLVVLVGLARVYLGAHWPTDVLGGYLLGGAVLGIAVRGYKRWSPRETKR
jgi:membrane-associated phospholipid phosphatase